MRSYTEALRLAAQLEPGTVLYLDDGEVQSGLFPPIDYRRDSLEEIHQAMIKRKTLVRPALAE